MLLSDAGSAGDVSCAWEIVSNIKSLLKLSGIMTSSQFFTNTAHFLELVNIAGKASSSCLAVAVLQTALVGLPVILICFDQSFCLRKWADHIT